MKKLSLAFVLILGFVFVKSQDFSYTKGTNYTLDSGMQITDSFSFEKVIILSFDFPNSKVDINLGEQIIELQVISNHQNEQDTTITIVMCVNLQDSNFVAILLDPENRAAGILYGTRKLTILYNKKSFKDDTDSGSNASKISVNSFGYNDLLCYTGRKEYSE